MNSPLKFNGVVLEETCSKCNGNPPNSSFLGIKLGNNGKWCTGCGGRGLVPNENGKAICDLIAHNLTTSEANIKYKVWK